MTTTAATPAGHQAVPDVARETLDRAVAHLLGRQHEDGWWQGELQTNVTMDRRGGPVEPVAAAHRRHLVELRGR
jgi:hypothetical protein